MDNIVVLLGRIVANYNHHHHHRYEYKAFSEEAPPIINLGSRHR
jgi:hypothetical protein